jgi:hypothetical protein
MGRECSHDLLASYLQRNIPIISAPGVLEHFHKDEIALSISHFEINI